jgi:hypothetical protein
MKPSAAANGARPTASPLPICYFCSSLDTMEPFERESEVFLLSRLLRNLRWRYCRTCTRHFLTVRTDPANRNPKPEHGVRIKNPEPLARIRKPHPGARTRQSETGARNP